MDRVFESFLKSEYDEINKLAADSDILEVLPLPRDGTSQAARPAEAPPQKYILRFRCKGFVREGSVMSEWDDWAVGVWFPEDYLRQAGAASVLTWLSPANPAHPNVRPPWTCTGELAPGTGLVEIAYRLYDMIRMENVTCVETDALQPELCSWARSKIAAGEFPVDMRPLKRRSRHLTRSAVEAEV